MPSYPDLGLTSPAQESCQAAKGSSVPIPPPPAVWVSLGLPFGVTSGAPLSTDHIGCGWWGLTVGQEPQHGLISSRPEMLAQRGHSM